jgi:hypothetical protein
MKNTGPPKLILNPLRPENVWQPKVGAPLGSRNALKTGKHTAEAKALRKRVWTFLSDVRGALADLESRRPKRPRGRPRKHNP